MAAPRNRVQLANISKLNQFTDERVLPEHEVPLFENGILDKEASRAIKRGAFQKSEYGEVSENTVEFYTANDLFSTRLKLIDYIVAKVGPSLFRYTAGAWETISGIIFNALAKLQTETFNDLVYVTDGITEPRVTDLETGQSMEITPPDTTGIIGSLGGSAVTPGDLAKNSYYKYVITYKTVTGDESNLSTPFTHFEGTSGSTTGLIGTLNFTGIPVPADERIIQKVVYRTEANGSTYYYWGILDNEATTFVDSKSDLLLDRSQIAKYVAIPSVIQDFAAHRERLFMSNCAYLQKNFVELPYDPVNDTYYWSLQGGTNGGDPTFPAGFVSYRVTLISSDGIQGDYREILNHPLGGAETYIDLFNIPSIFNAGNFAQSHQIYRRLGAAENTGDWELHQELSTALDTLEATQNLRDNTPALVSPKIWVDPTYETISYPNSVIWSEVGQPLNILATSIIRVFPDDGDTITAIYDDRDGVLVFKENSICKIYTQGNPVNWRVVKVTEELGCDDINSIHKTEDRYYFQQFKQLYLYPVSGEPMSLGIKDEITADDIITSTAYSSRQSWLLINVVNNGAGKTLVFDEEIKSWYVFKYSSYHFPAMCEIKQGTNRGVVICSNDVTDQILQYKPDERLEYNSSTRLDSVEYDMKIKSKIWLTPDLKQAFRFTKLFTNYEKKDRDVLHTLNGVSYLDAGEDGTKYLEISSIASELTHEALFQYTIEGMEEFTYAQIEYYLTRRRLASI